MEQVILDKKDVLLFLKDSLTNLKTSSVHVDNAKYHHNTSYNCALSIVKNGILSLDALNKKGIINYSNELLELLNDTESHINGKDGVSLSVVGLSDVKCDEIEYDPFIDSQVDFLISSDVVARRSSINYANEFITNEHINPEKLKSIDFRLIKYIDSLFDKTIDDDTIESLIQRYNCIRDVALMLKEEKLSIPIREMSDEDNSALDIDKTANSPVLLLK